MNILTSLLFWLVLGGIAGWLAGVAMEVNTHLGFMSTVAPGIAGALVGSSLFNLLGVRMLPASIEVRMLPALTYTKSSLRQYIPCCTR